MPEYLVTFSNGHRRVIEASSIAEAKRKALERYPTVASSGYKHEGKVQSAHEIGSAFHPGSSMGPKR